MSIHPHSFHIQLGLIDASKILTNKIAGVPGCDVCETTAALKLCMLQTSTYLNTSEVLLFNHAHNVAFRHCRFTKRSPRLSIRNDMMREFAISISAKGPKNKRRRLWTGFRPLLTKVRKCIRTLHSEYNFLLACLHMFQVCIEAAIGTGLCSQTLAGPDTWHYES